MTISKPDLSMILDKINNNIPAQKYIEISTNGWFSSHGYNIIVMLPSPYAGT
jgi:hypothetical protein